METFTLNNGSQIPKVGIGVYLVPSADVGAALARAFEVGYRLVDTANMYFNERAVGRAIRDSGLTREDIFLTTKLWPSDFGYTRTPPAIDGSLKRLDTDYVDLLLLHQQYGDYLGAWKAMEEAVSAGKARAIGVCNFSQKKLTEITTQATIMPAVSQVECHPYFQQRELKAFLEQFGTVLESWYPIGHGNQRLLSEPLFAELGRKYGKSPVQVILRWQIQDGNIAIPKSTNPAHIQSNIELFDFELTPEEMERIAALDTPRRLHNVPAFVERIVFPAVHFDYDKRQR